MERWAEIQVLPAPTCVCFILPTQASPWRAVLTMFSSWLPSSSSLPSRSSSFSLISCKKDRKWTVRLGGWCKGQRVPFLRDEPGNHIGSDCGLWPYICDSKSPAWWTALGPHSLKLSFWPTCDFVAPNRAWKRVEEGSALLCGPLTPMDKLKILMGPRPALWDLFLIV